MKYLGETYTYTFRLSYSFGGSFKHDNMINNFRIHLVNQFLMVLVIN